MSDDTIKKIKDFLKTIENPEATYYEDELWDCGNYDDVYSYGCDEGRADLAREIEELIESHNNA